MDFLSRIVHGRTGLGRRTTRVARVSNLLYRRYLVGRASPAHPAQATHRGWRWICVLAVNTAVSLNPVLAAEQAPFSQYQVKAAWLVNFARFAEWPARALPAGKGPIVVAVLGKDPFGSELEKAMKGKIVEGRSFSIRRISADQDLRACHLLFVASSERRRWRELSLRIKDAPILTVGESEEFLDQGGIINFRIENNSVRFEINLNAAQAAGIRLDPNLLKVASRVKGKYE